MTDRMTTHRAVLEAKGQRTVVDVVIRGPDGPGKDEIRSAVITLLDFTFAGVIVDPGTERTTYTVAVPPDLQPAKQEAETRSVEALS